MATLYLFCVISQEKRRYNNLSQCSFILIPVPGSFSPTSHTRPLATLQVSLTMHTPAFTALFLLCGAISIAYAAPLRSRDDVQVVSGQVSSADHGFFHTEDAVLYSDGVFDFDETNGGAYHIVSNTRLGFFGVRAE